MGALSLKFLHWRRECIRLLLASYEDTLLTMNYFLACSGKLYYIKLSNQSVLMRGFYRRTSLPCLCVFPVSSSWIVESQNITFKIFKSVSLTILWRSNNGKILIFMLKTSEADASLDVKLQAMQGFRGIAPVEAFYVSGMLIPHGVSSLKFIVQVSGFDGSCQQLVDSPSF